MAHRTAPVDQSWAAATERNSLIGERCPGSGGWELRLVHERRASRGDVSASRTELRRATRDPRAPAARIQSLVVNEVPQPHDWPELGLSATTNADLAISSLKSTVEPDMRPSEHSSTTTRAPSLSNTLRGERRRLHMSGALWSSTSMLVIMNQREHARDTSEGAAHESSSSIVDASSRSKR